LHAEDALYQASLILGEHAIEKHPETVCGKVLVGVYVMYTRLEFFTAIGFLLAPVLYRVLHTLHAHKPKPNHRQ